MVIPVLLTGCGPSTPEAAVQDFYKAIDDGNWDAYLGSVLPENIRRMTEEDARNEKERFLAGDSTFEELKFKTVYDKKDKNKAEVELTEGKITGTNPMTGEKETTTIAEIKEQYEITPSLGVQKYKGRWYVVVPMASADMAETEL